MLPQREREREKESSWKAVIRKPKSLFPVSSHFPLVSHLHLSLSLYTLLIFSRSLHWGIQSLHWDWGSLKVIQNYAARCLHSPSYLPPCHPVYPQHPPLSPQGAWILLSSEKPRSKSQPGFSAPAAGLTGCPTALQRQRGGRPGGVVGEGVWNKGSVG